MKASARTDARWSEAGAPERLTRRETEVLAAIGAGLSNPEIAEALCIAHSTLDHHISAIYRKLRLSNRYQAVRLAIARGLVSADPPPGSPPGLVAARGGVLTDLARVPGRAGPAGDRPDLGAR